VKKKLVALLIAIIAGSAVGCINIQSHENNNSLVNRIRITVNSKEVVKETLIYCLCGMKCKAHGAQEPRHI